MSKSSSCKCDECQPQKTESVLPNPNPSNFKITRTKQVGPFCVVEVNYPDCKNYEGNKILVIKDITKKELNRLTSLDPHFCDKSNVNIIARFKPTWAGFDLAVGYCNYIEKVFE